MMLDLHSIGVHRLANIEIIVLEVTNNLLSVGLSTLLEVGDLGIISPSGLQRLLDLLHVAYKLVRLNLGWQASSRTLKMAEIRLLVERSLA